VHQIRVLDLRDTREIGGPGKTILETFRAIDSARFELHLGVFLRRDESERNPFIEAARACGMPVHVLRGYNQYDPRLIWRLARLVKRLDIDIVHAHEVSSDVLTYLASKLHRVAIMTTLHGWIGNNAKQRLLMALDRRILPSFDRVLVVSEQIRDALHAQGVPGENMLLLRNAIVVERYRRTGQRGFLASLVGAPLKAPVIASIGRLSPEKGHRDLIDALAIAASRVYRVSAILAGDGPDRTALSEKIRALGLEDSVYLPGYVSEPQRILEEADLVVLPSHTEGLPNAALEAMVMEVPLLATRAGGTPEVVTDRETGRLVAPRSPEALAGGIIDFLTHPAPWTEMARRGREVVERRFNFQTRTRHLETIYAELAAGSRA
jgi:glycosyltransferase involved in cell wall biosynthesis